MRLIVTRSTVVTARIEKSQRVEWTLDAFEIHACLFILEYFSSVAALKRSRFIIGLNPYFHGTPYAQCTRGVRQFWVGWTEGLTVTQWIIGHNSSGSRGRACSLLHLEPTTRFPGPCITRWRYTPPGRHVLLLCKLLSLGHTLVPTWKLWNSSSEFRDAKSSPVDDRGYFSNLARETSKNRSIRSTFTEPFLSSPIRNIFSRVPFLFLIFLKI